MSDIRLIELLTEALKREAAERERANKAEAALSEFQPIYRPPSGANAMKLYTCTVVRKQSWTIEVAAENAEAAKDEADHIAWRRPPDDDWSYETTAVEMPE